MVLAHILDGTSMRGRCRCRATRMARATANRSIDRADKRRNNPRHDVGDRGRAREKQEKIARRTRTKAKRSRLTTRKRHGLCLKTCWPKGLRMLFALLLGLGPLVTAWTPHLLENKLCEKLWRQPWPYASTMLGHEQHEPASTCVTASRSTRLAASVAWQQRISCSRVALAAAQHASMTHGSSAAHQAHARARRDRTACEGCT